MTKKKLFTTKNLAKIAILSAIATVLMYFDFPLPFIALPFYKIDFSEVAVLIGGFALGPMSAAVIEFMKILLNLLFTSTQTAFVGEISNFIVGCAFVVPAAIIYQRNKTKKGAITGLVVGALTMTVLGFFSNLFVVIPAYVNIMGLSLDMIVGMGTKIFPVVTNTFTLVLFCTTPFNLIKGFTVSLITALIYKHVSPLLKK